MTIDTSEKSSGAGRLDAVTFEVLKNAFVTLIDQMAEQILRTCYSFVIYMRDFSCCLCDANGDTVMQGTQDLAVHVGTLHFTAKALLDFFEGDIHEGDVFAINDPYAGGTHFSDVRIVRPVFWAGELVALLQVNGHWADVGGKYPGSFDFTAAQFYGTGMRITPVRVVDRGVFRKDVAHLIVAGMRIPEERLGDLQAQVEATGVGERELHRLIGKYGIALIQDAFAECQDYVERMARARLARLPTGEWETEDYLDEDYFGNEGLVRVAVKLTLDGSSIVYDLTGSDPPVNTILNGAFGSSFSSVVSGTKMFFPDIPLNSGFYRVMDVTLPENTVVNAALPIAVDGFGTGSHEKIMNSIFELWSMVMPERSVACAFNLEYLQLGGRDLRPGYQRDYMWYDWMLGGWGGRRGRDGQNGAPPVFGAGLAIQPTEPQERLSPVVVLEQEFITDSGGPGQHRGGVGIGKAARLTECDRSMLSFFTDRARSITWGIFGGLPSYPCGAWLTRSGVREFFGTSFSGMRMASGDEVWRPSAGGGGLGDPLARDPQLVLEDVRDGYVSRERAAKDYGVQIRKDGGTYELDQAATTRLREEIRSARKSWLAEDPELVRQKWVDGELDLLDTIRRYGVIINLRTKELLPRTTEQFRNMLQRRAAAWWD
jgi:N-methylhydantoinase B